ncbi:MAG: hypothetical protein ACYDC1_11940 [Limisphaerales bacterium]
MKTKSYYLTMIRPVGSSCWTFARISTGPKYADRSGVEERNRKVPFADGSLHLQSTATIRVELPAEPDQVQTHNDPETTATVKIGIP